MKIKSKFYSVTLIFQFYENHFLKFSVNLMIHYIWKKYHQIVQDLLIIHLKEIDVILLEFKASKTPPNKHFRKKNFKNGNIASIKISPQEWFVAITLGNLIRWKTQNLNSVWYWMSKDSFVYWILWKYFFFWVVKWRRITFYINCKSLLIWIYWSWNISFWIFFWSWIK